MALLQPQMTFMRAIPLILVFTLLPMPDFGQQQSAPAAPIPVSHGPATATDKSDQSNENATAAAKAAARKKRFDEDKRKLEESEAASPQAPDADPEQTLFVTPAVVTMMLGDAHSFSAFDIDGKTVTADAEWSLSNSYVAELTTGGDPTVTIKGPGTVTLRARIGGREAEANITVFTGDKIPYGTILWSVPKIAGFVGSRIVQAVPHRNGPDIYEIEKNGQGETIIRALLSDGRQMWLKRFSDDGRPGTIKGNPVSIMPH